MQRRRVTNWMANHNFPFGMTFFLNGLYSDPLKQKAQMLKTVVENVCILSFCFILLFVFFHTLRKDCISSLSHSLIEIITFVTHLEIDFIILTEICSLYVFVLVSLLIALCYMICTIANSSASFKFKTTIEDSIFNR